MHTIRLCPTLKTLLLLLRLVLQLLVKLWRPAMKGLGQTG